MLIPYRRFGTTYRSYFWGSRNLYPPRALEGACAGEGPWSSNFISFTFNPSLLNTDCADRKINLYSITQRRRFALKYFNPLALELGI